MHKSTQLIRLDLQHIVQSNEINLRLVVELPTWNKIAETDGSHRDEAEVEGL